ncbi:SHOCT domain-containing protein [Hymenobacter algoricola]|uniref:SHOCT domain-containing protein n=1 Tax=Hymenobacter algoricola TaxID=486267 RepID=A0ABP7MIL4_9BACT
MEKDPSPLDTLRQLKEWLDAGTITPAEFETLKRKLLFSEPTAAGPAAPVNRPEPTATSGPVEEPMLPPIVPHTTPPLPPVAPPSAPAPPAETFSRPFESGRPGASPSAEDGYDTETREPEEDEVDMPYVAPARNPLSTILIVGGILALLALVAYLMLGNRESEHLSSISQTEADSQRPAPETGPQAEQIDLPPAAAPETVRVAPAVAPVAAPAADSVRVPAPAATPPAPEAPTDYSAVRARVEGGLAAYYEDLKAAPFSAASYFAPSVERFYTLQNTTPAAIEAELARSHFPEFLEAETVIEPGSLKISEPVDDGSRVVTFLERSRALRQSLQKRQQTRAQVRIRLDRNFKIKYLRQERLLENTFTD